MNSMVRSDFRPDPASPPRPFGTSADMVRTPIPPACPARPGSRSGPATAGLVGLLAAFSVFAPTAPGGPIDPSDPPAGRFSDEWAEIYIGDNKAGYAHSSMTRRGDRIETKMHFFLALGRAQQPIEVRLTQQVVETLEGVPVRFSTDTDMSVMKSSLRGEVKDGRVEIVTSQYGMEQKQEYAYPEGALMAWGTYRESIRRGFEPGTEYTLRVYAPEMRLDDAVESVTRVGEKESFVHDGRELEGRRVTVELRAPIGAMEMVSWVRDDGTLVKSRLPVPGLGDMVLVTSDQASAMSEFVPPEFFMNTVIKADRKIDYKSAERITYRIIPKDPSVSLDDLPETDSQRVVGKTEKSVDVEVHRQTHRGSGEGDEATLDGLRKGQAPRRNDPKPGSDDQGAKTGGRRSGKAATHDGTVNASSRRPTAQPAPAFAEYLSGNLMINVDDPTLTDLARRAAGGETEPFALADRLRRFVTDYVEGKTLNIGFATASEVARTKEGDCSEHAVLLAALARINGLPARVAVGLAYVPIFGGQDDIFGYHMWTQVYIDGRWIDLDAALRETRCSPIRLTFATSSLKHAGIADLSMPLISKLGAIDLKILEIK